MQMSGMLAAVGDEVSLIVSRKRARVERLLGEGGQGEVFEISTLERASSSRRYALKLYFRNSATHVQQQMLAALVDRGAPDDRFLWPLDLAQVPSSRTFGYVMDLRQDRFQGLVDYLRGRLSTSFDALATAGFQLADSFLRLHAQGLCYRDISWGNVFFDPRTGDVLICDNDNVAVDGDVRSGILGTPLFMAPEIVRGEKRPNSDTDRYSLAVLLFYMLMRHNPLEGARERAFPILDNRALVELFGRHPVFIFDPDDVSNRPDPASQANPLTLWPLYPTFLRDLFIKAFTGGLHDPANGRIREFDWKRWMIRLRDSIIYCGCGAQNFADLYPPTKDPVAPTCWSCSKPTILPPRIQLGPDVVTLNHDRALYPHHIQGKTFDFSRVVAAVTPHPTKPGVWGLQNRSDDTWMAFSADDTQTPVPPGRTAGLRTGLRIQFRGVKGRIL